MEFSLRDLQLLTEKEFSVEETRLDLMALTEFFIHMPYYDIGIEGAFVKTRKLPKSLAGQQKIFFVDSSTKSFELPERLQSEALGMVKAGHIVYSGRLVYPIMDVKGQVMGFCGWDPFVTPKYLDSHNHGYKAKDRTFYGMEKLPEYYRNDLPVYVTEGIVCCLYLRSIGLQSIAMLGSHLTEYVIQILKRLEKRLIFIPDNDMIAKTDLAGFTGKLAGEGFIRQIKHVLPKAKVIQSTIAKDVDDTRLFNDGQYEKRFCYELKQVGINPFMQYETLRIC